jgi:spore protease
MGVPVIAIGIPMVVDAGTIVSDALTSAMVEASFFTKVIDNQLANMYVTPKNIDETTKRLSFTVSEAINIALDMEE